MQVAIQGYVGSRELMASYKSFALERFIEGFQVELGLTRRGSILGPSLDSLTILRVWLRRSKSFCRLARLIEQGRQDVVEGAGLSGARAGSAQTELYDSPERTQVQQTSSSRRNRETFSVSMSTLVPDLCTTPNEIS